MLDKDEKAVRDGVAAGMRTLIEENPSMGRKDIFDTAAKMFSMSVDPIRKIAKEYEVPLPPKK